MSEALKVDEIKARWAEHGEALRSAQDDDKVVTVSARRCEAQVREFLRGAPEDVAHLLGEVERLRHVLEAVDYNRGGLPGEVVEGVRAALRGEPLPDAFTALYGSGKP